MREEYAENQAMLDDLKQHLDDLIRRAGALGYHPTQCIRMRNDPTCGDRKMCTLLVQTDEVQSGFRWCIEHGMIEHSIEAVVVKLGKKYGKRLFPAETVEWAKLRLRMGRMAA